MKRLTDKMVEELNNELEKSETCLRYEVVKGIDGEICTSYKLTVVDKFIVDSNVSYSIPNATKDFENFVRNYFLENYSVENTGFSNSIVTLVTWKNEGKIY